MGEYLAHLAPGGTLSMSSAEPDALEATVRAAVAAAGHDPRTCVRRLGGNNAVILARNDAFSVADDAILAVLDPSPGSGAAARVLTDDRPYADAIADVPGALRGESGPVRRVLVRSLAVQLGAAAAAGLLFLGLPLVVRGRRELAPGWGPAVLFSAGLGFGWFTVEIALLHRLVVFVGHPTWAVAGVVAAMLVGTGLGSLSVADRPATRGNVIQAVMLALAAITVTSGLVVPAAAALRVEAFDGRMALAMVAIFPMAVALGRPMPLGLRAFGAHDPGLVAWMWAVNGWGSVAASLLTVAVVRYFGYQAAFGTASAAYVLAFLVAVLRPPPVR